MNRFAGNNGWTCQKLINGLSTAVLFAGMLLISGMMGWLFAGATAMAWVMTATIVSVIVSPRLSPRLLMRRFAARQLDPLHAPWLYANLRELARSAGLPKIPSLRYLPSQQLGAFTTGPP